MDEATHDSLRLLVRMHGWPLGTASLPAGLTDDEFAARLWDQFGQAVATHDAEAHAGGLPGARVDPDAVRSACEPLDGVSPLPAVTVVVTTCGRHTTLVRCLESILAADYPEFEVLVVDNRPVGSSTAEVLERRFGSDPRLAVVPEHKQGLSAARNRGLREARGSIVAYTDDDVIVDRRWLSALVGAMSRRDAVCATGLILPAALGTRNEQLQEEFCGFSKGFTPQVFELGTPQSDPMFPYSPGIFGSGANAAFQAAALLELGGFDESLGAGTAAKGGEDLDLFLRLILARHRIVYEPGAVIWHRHKETDAELRQQVRDYGTGLSAMITKHLISHSRSRRAIARRVPQGVRRLVDPRSPKNDRRSADFPRSLALLELSGIAYGPLAYARSRRTDKRTNSVLPAAG